MANINQIKVDTFVQVVKAGSANIKARVVGLTDKKVRVQLMENGAYLKDTEGNPKRTLVDPKNIKFYKEVEA